MALNPLISLQAQAPDVGGAINNALVNTQNFQKTQANRMAMDEATQMAELKSMVQGGEQARLAFQQGGREGLTEFLMNRMQQGPTVKGGRGMQDTQELLNMTSDLSIPDEQIVGVLDNVRNVGERFGIIKPMAGAELGKEGEAFVKGEVDFLRSGTSDLKKRAGVINTNFNKIEGLSKQMSPDGKLPRSAINAGIMSLARMISPGVVTDRDAASVAGVADPVQAGIQLFDKMIDRGADAEKVERAKIDFIRSFDPANPETFNADGFKEIATTIAAAEADTILNDWSELQARGQRGGLSERVMNANFGGENKSIFSLQKFTQPSQGGDPEIDDLVNKYGN